MTKRLVAYFSASGVTAELAKLLSQAAGADLYEIKPAVPYSKADLDWQNSKSRSSVEMKDKAFHPALADTDANIADYAVVFVGFPIWWYTAPTIINTFLESYDFSGKTLVPFATSGSSGLGKTKENLTPSVSDTAIWKEGKLLNGKVSKDALVKWVESLNL
ncbi:flavodoxin [Breznakiellaceae bacterium SP9]